MRHPSVFALVGLLLAVTVTACGDDDDNYTCAQGHISGRTYICDVTAQARGENAIMLIDDTDTVVVTLPLREARLGRIRVVLDTTWSATPAVPAVTASSGPGVPAEAP